MNGKYRTFEIRCNICNRKLGILEFDKFVPVNNNHGKNMPMLKTMQYKNYLAGRLICSRCHNKGDYFIGG